MARPCWCTKPCSSWDRKNIDISIYFSYHLVFAGSCQTNPYHNQWVVSDRITLPLIVAIGAKVKETDSLLGATRRLLSVTCDCLVQLSHDWKLKEADRSVKDPDRWLDLLGIFLGIFPDRILRVSKTGPSGWVETNSEFKRQSARGFLLHTGISCSNRNVAFKPPSWFHAIVARLIPR